MLNSAPSLGRTQSEINAPALRAHGIQRPNLDDKKPGEIDKAGKLSQRS